MVERYWSDHLGRYVTAPAYDDDTACWQRQQEAILRSEGAPAPDEETEGVRTRGDDTMPTYDSHPARQLYRCTTGNVGDVVIAVNVNHEAAPEVLRVHISELRGWHPSDLETLPTETEWLGQYR